MKKMLIGDCPCCGSPIAVELSKIRERPIGIPKQCNNCSELLEVTPQHPKLSRTVMIGSYIIIFLSIGLSDWSAAFYGFGMLYYLLLWLLVYRTIGRPIFTVFTPERDFLEEELTPAWESAKNQQNKAEMATPRKPSD